MYSNELLILRPCIAKRITQKFDENKACIYPSGRLVGTATTCPDGSRSYYKSLGMKGHNGLDIAGVKGEEIYHAANFTGWMKVEKDWTGGIGVDVVSDEAIFFSGTPPQSLTGKVETKDNGFLSHVKMRYWHLKAPIGYDKKPIKVGQTIGLMGNTGASTATHLHFAPKWCDAKGNGIASDNGYYGAFDPWPYYIHHITAKDHATFTNQPVIISDPERREMADQLSMLETILVGLQKLAHNV